jgi:hypothetical protein
MNKRVLAAIAAMVTCILTSGCVEEGESAGTGFDLRDADRCASIDCGGSCESCDLNAILDTFDWNNCGQPTTFPDLACQIDTSGDVLEYEVQLVAGITHIEVVIDPHDGHYREPEYRTRAWFTAIDKMNQEFVLSSREDETDLPNYDKPHTIYLTATMVTTDDVKYVVRITGEHGKYSLNGLVVRRPVLVGAL